MGPTGLTQQALESRLWAAANALRGPVDPADFKAYIFPLLFYKRICDAWDEEHEPSDRGLRRGPHRDESRGRLSPVFDPRWLPLEGHPAGSGERRRRCCRRSLDRVQQANPETLAGIFGDVRVGQQGKTPRASLIDLLDAFGSLDLTLQGRQ